MEAYMTEDEDSTIPLQQSASSTINNKSAARDTNSAHTSSTGYENLYLNNNHTGLINSVISAFHSSQSAYTTPGTPAMGQTLRAASPSEYGHLYLQSPPGDTGSDSSYLSQGYSSMSENISQNSSIQINNSGLSQVARSNSSRSSSPGDVIICHQPNKSVPLSGTVVMGGRDVLVRSNSPECIIIGETSRPNSAASNYSGVYKNGSSNPTPRGGLKDNEKNKAKKGQDQCNNIIELGPDSLSSDEECQDEDFNNISALPHISNISKKRTEQPQLSLDDCRDVGEDNDPNHPKTPDNSKKVASATLKMLDKHIETLHQQLMSHSDKIAATKDPVVHLQLMQQQRHMLDAQRLLLQKQQQMLSQVYGLKPQRPTVMLGPESPESRAIPSPTQEQASPQHINLSTPPPVVPVEPMSLSVSPSNPNHHRNCVSPISIVPTDTGVRSPSPMQTNPAYSENLLYPAPLVSVSNESMVNPDSPHVKHIQPHRYVSPIPIVPITENLDRYSPLLGHNKTPPIERPTSSVHVNKHRSNIENNATMFPQIQAIGHISPQNWSGLQMLGHKVKEERLSPHSFILPHSYASPQNTIPVLKTELKKSPDLELKRETVSPVTCPISSSQADPNRLPSPLAQYFYPAPKREVVTPPPPPVLTGSPGDANDLIKPVAKMSQLRGLLAIPPKMKPIVSLQVNAETSGSGKNAESPAVTKAETIPLSMDRKGVPMTTIRIAPKDPTSIPHTIGQIIIPGQTLDKANLVGTTLQVFHPVTASVDPNKSVPLDILNTVMLGASLPPPTKKPKTTETAKSDEERDLVSGSRFISREEPKRRRRKPLNDQNKKPYMKKCTICSNIFYKLEEYKDHMNKEHSQTFKYWCEECQRGYNDPRCIEEHIAKHEHRAYPCEHCSKSFRSLSGYKRHQSEHTGIYLYRCQHCGEGYNIRKQFEAHQNRHVGHGYECFRCKKVFFHKDLLTSHMSKCLNTSVDPQLIHQKLMTGSPLALALSKVNVKPISPSGSNASSITISESSADSTLNMSMSSTNSVGNLESSELNNNDVNHQLEEQELAKSVE